MKNTKHKLSGYAIKGDGTQETAERIRKVFEADGWKLSSAGFDFREVDGCYCVHHKLPIKESVHCYRPNHLPDFITVIPLTEAARIVFGDELKVGMKVVSGKCNVEGRFKAEDRIGEIVQTSHYQDGYDYKLKFSIPNEKDLEVWCSVKRRATITDFLRTLPSDIAERALRQVDEGDANDYCDSLGDAISCGIDWDETDEGIDYWCEVEEANYDRARAILAEKDRVGKWWNYPDGGMFRATDKNSAGDLYGYGVNRHGNWFDRTKRSDEAAQLVACPVFNLHKLTPATPEEVEAMLNEQRVKMGLVQGAKIRTAHSGTEWVIGGEAHYNDEHNALYDSDGMTLFFEGKWAEIITPAPEKPFKIECDCEMIVTTTVEQNCTCGKNEPTDNFPRVMWVFDNEVKKAQRCTVVGWDETELPWETTHSYFKYASDTHPVTGEPAVKKSEPETDNPVAAFILSLDKAAKEEAYDDWNDLLKATCAGGKPSPGMYTLEDIVVSAMKDYASAVKKDVVEQIREVVDSRKGSVSERME